MAASRVRPPSTASPNTMSALLMPTCGRPGAVSSIFTAIVERFGTLPIPVNQFLCGAFGLGFGLGGGELFVGAGVVIGAGAVVGSEPLLPVHAALASIVPAMIT